jgi:hypothetical protein
LCQSHYATDNPSNLGKYVTADNYLAAADKGMYVLLLECCEPCYDIARYNARTGLQAAADAACAAVGGREASGKHEELAQPHARAKA